MRQKDDHDLANRMDIDALAQNHKMGGIKNNNELKKIRISSTAVSSTVVTPALLHFAIFCQIFEKKILLKQY